METAMAIARSPCHPAKPCRRSGRAPGTWATAAASGRRGAGAAARARPRHDADRHGRDVCGRRRRGGGGRGHRGRRDGAFLVSKVLPSNASRTGDDRRLRAQPQAARHRPDRPLSAALARQLCARGHADRRSKRCKGGQDPALGRLQFRRRGHGGTARAGGAAVAANQVLYNLTRRGIEHDLLPWRPSTACR